MAGLKHIENIYFLGIGGIGMSSQALYFHAAGKKVSGYDRTRTELTIALEKQGIAVHYHDDISLIPENIELVVITPAIPQDLGELKHLRKKGVPVMKRSEMLGLLTAEKKCIAVGGTHGKTTTSTMAAHIFRQSDLDCSAFLGGVSKNYLSNLLLSAASDYIITEADEYDRSFLQLKPFCAVITSADADHLDIYGTHDALIGAYADFAGLVRRDGLLLMRYGLDERISKKGPLNTLTYGMEEEADYHPLNTRIDHHRYHFDLAMPSGTIQGFELGIPGRINVLNAVAAAAVALHNGIHDADVRKALATFTGVKRRLELILDQDDIVYIDDYAHHPEEIKACIGAVRELYPGKQVTGVFQPHLYTRTRDFADAFARSLENLDDLILLPVYPAREEAIPGIDSAFLLEKINMKNKILCQGCQLLDLLKNHRPEVLITIGAGDIDRFVQPIASLFMKQDGMHHEISYEKNAE